MEALCIRPGVASALVTDEEARGPDDLEDEDEEPQAPAVIRRKVSFADAFGLNLVSVKEFDNAVERGSEDSPVSPEKEEVISTEDFQMFCLFTVPPTPEELELKVQKQKLELESIELLPKTTTLRSVVRVLNLCYKKLVYARVTLDRWRSHFDLLAEYVPGSSDRKTDRFTFQYTLVPPFDKEGTRLEFCLRYETSVGTFWANNNGMNYVLFCHNKVRENGPQIQEESNGKAKKSCLKANRRESAEEAVREVLNTSTCAAESEGTGKTDVPPPSHRTEAQSSRHAEENKHNVDCIKSLHRAARWARAQPCPQRRQSVPPDYSHDSPQQQQQKGSQPAPLARRNLSSALRMSRKAQSRGNGAQILANRQGPWAARDRGHGHDQEPCVDGTWTERAQITSESHQEALQRRASDTAAVTSTRSPCANRTEEAISTEPRVFDVWQVFINGSDSETPELEEWLQTATPVPPPDNEDPPVRRRASRQVHVGRDTPDLDSARSNACHPPPDTAETSLALVALNSDDGEEAVVALARVTSRGDDNAGAGEAPQRSETNSPGETAQEFSLAGAKKPVSKGCADSPGERRERQIWEREERAGIMGGIGGDEPFTMRTADLVTSSGESQTTDMTAMPRSPNASAVDTISRGAGLSHGREGKVTATAHNTADDTLAFKETMRQGTADGERFVVSSRRQGAEEGLTTKCAGNKVSKKEERARPRVIEECQVSGGGGGEPRRDPGRECDSLEQGEQNETDASSLAGLRSGENSKDYLQNQWKGFHRGNREALSPTVGVQDESGHKAEVETDCKIARPFNEDERPRRNGDSRNALAGHNKNTAIFPGINISQTKPQPRGEKSNDKDEIREANATRMETNVTGDRAFQTGKDCCEIMQERRKPREEIPPSTATKEQPFSTTERTLEPEMIHQSDTSRSPPERKVEEISWTHSHSVHKEHVGCRMSSEELALKEAETSAALQLHTLEGMDEDISRRDIDERLRIGKLKIETEEGEEGEGDSKKPRGGSKSAPVKLKEQELSAEVESPLRVEYQKTAERTEENPIRDDGVITLVEERGMLREGSRRGTAWREVLDCQYSVGAPEEGGDCLGGDGDIVRSAITGGEKRKETLPADGTKGQALHERDGELHFAANTDKSAHLPNDPNSTVGSESRQGSSGSQASTEAKHRSVGLIANSDESCNKTLGKQSNDSRGKLKQVPTWQSTLFLLFHVTRLLICASLVAGFFLAFFYYDFKLFFVLYGFSMCCWIYKWRSFRFGQKEREDEIDGAED